MTAPIGKYPAVKHFEEIIISGLILYVSQPHKFPVLPNPHITSSATRGILYFFNIG